MESEAPQTTLYLHKETRVDLQPHRPDSIIHIQLPSTSSFALSTRTHRKVISALSPSKNEEAFQRQSVATSGSLYFYKSRKYPRSCLWRCLEDNTVLELRSADLSKEENEVKEADLILRLGFSSGIRHEGIALADSIDQDVLNVFVLTKSDELYTFTLRPDFFCRASASEGEFERWWTVFKPSSLTISTSHRLIASHPLELLVALGDGRLMRLVRKAGSDGSHWDESAYSNGQWTSSLRGLIRWQGSNTVKYNGKVLDQNTAVAVKTSPDGKHLFAVCLNHTLRAWNVKSGKVTFSRDLLDVDHDPHETVRVMLDPGISQVLDIFEVGGGQEGDMYYIATYSPQNSGVFKFWAIRDADHANLGVRALFPDEIFRVPDPDDGALWTVADFRLGVTPGTTELELWILMRLNRRYKLYYRKLDLYNLDTDWSTGWSMSAVDVSQREPSQQPPFRVFDLDAEDVSDRWLTFILSPGRLPEMVLETALIIYDHDQGQSATITKNTKTSLKERLAKSVGSYVQLQRSNASENGLARFREQVNDQWTSFWTIASELDQSRWEPLSLGYNVDAGMPWIVFADACCAVRQCSQTELLVHNSPKDLARHNNMLLKHSIEDGGSPSNSVLPDELALLIDSAARFRATFSDALRFSCKNALNGELWQDPSYSVPVRIQSFYDRCDFAGQIGDRQYNDLAASLKETGGFDGLNTASFQAIIATLPHSMSTEASGLVSTTFGLKTLVKGAQDMIELHTRILTDLLLLVVFVDMEVDRDECAMEDIDTPQVFMMLADQLKQYQMMRWLATNTRPEPQGASDNSLVSVDAGRAARSSPKPSTVLENLFASDPKPQSYPDESQTITLTNNILDLLKWVTGGSDPTITLDQVLVHVQCNLLKDNNIGLASSFLQYQPSTAWAIYIRGRFCLLQNELPEAAVQFQKAAYKLSRPNSHFNYATASAGLLSSLDASFLSTGLQNYYTHILTFFEPLAAHTQVQHFARLALQFPPRTHQETHHSSTSITNHHTTDLHDRLITSLFDSSLALSDYDSAYTSLTRLPKSHKTAALHVLLSTLVANDAIPTLLGLPLTTLQNDIALFLAEKARSGLDAPGSVPWYKILYAWRAKHGDMRGAASTLMEQVEKSEVGGGKRRGGAEEEGEWLVLINALAVAGGDKDEEGWVFVGGEGQGQSGKKRRVVMLEEVRRGYQEFLDRREGVERGRFGILAGDGDEMDFS